MTPATTGLLGGKLTKLDEMNAMVKATTITAKGLSRATGGVALYVAHIRQMDREQQRGVTPTHSSKRDIERG